MALKSHQKCLRIYISGSINLGRRVVSSTGLSVLDVFFHALSRELKSKCAQSSPLAVDP